MASYNNCSFERILKIKKVIFLFGISSIFMFLFYANEESDDVIGRFTKTVQLSIKNASRNIKAVILKLGMGNVHQKIK